MDFLPDSEIVNLKYQLAQQIKASINRAAASKSSNTPFLESFVDTLVDEIAELKIEISKLSLAVSNIKNLEKSQVASSSQVPINYSKNLDDLENIFSTFPIKLDSEYLKNIDNFYYPESGKNDSHFIWLGPDNKTSFELPVKISFPIKVILSNVRFITDATKESLEISINGDPLKLEFFQENEGYIISAVWIPLHNSAKDKMQIDISVDESVSVQDIYPEASDTRKLCLALKEIEINNNSLEYVNT